MSDQDMEDIAAYLQGADAVKPSAAVERQGAEASGRLRRLPRRERARASMRRSTPKPPVLAGQHVDYLEQALAAYRNGRRKNVVMNGMAQLLKPMRTSRSSPAYFASQPSPLATATTESK